MPRFTLVLILALAFAGCLGPDDTSATTASSGNAPPEETGEGSTPPNGAGAPASGTADEEGGAAANGTTPESFPPVTTTVVNGTLSVIGAGYEADGASVCCIIFSRNGENIEDVFTLEGNVTGLVAEVAWEDTQADLDLAVRAPDYVSHFPPKVNESGIRGSSGHSYYDYGGEPGMGDSPVRLVVTDAEAFALEGEWTWNVRGKYASDTPFTFYLTVFRSEVPTEDWTAMPS